MGKSVLYLLACLMFTHVAHASPPTLTYQGRIVKSDGTGFEYNQTRFNFQITGPDGPYSSCVIYDETVTGIDMTNSGGMFDVSMGASHSFPSVSTFTILDAFNNSNSFYCEGGSTTVPGYVASPSDGRKLRVRFYDGSSWQTISPDTVIRSVPYAGFAMSAQKLGNYQSTDFALKPAFTSCASGSFLTWDSTAGFGCTTAPTGGGGGSVSDSAYSVKGIVQFDTDAATSGMVYSSSGVAKVNIGTSANQVVALDGSAKLPAVDGSTLTNVNAVKIQGKAVTLTSPTANQVLQYDGTKFVNASIADNDTLGSLLCADGYVAYKSGGAWTCLPVSSTSVNNSIVSRNGSGGFAAASADLNSLILRDGATAGTVAFSVPTAFTAYNLIWPSTGGTAGQVLAKGTGDNLQWSTVQTNSLTSGNIWVGNASNQATAVTMSGDATMDSSGALTLATAGTAGTYYKVTTDSKGRVTSGSASLSSSDIPSAAGDVSGSFSALSVDKLKGKAIDSTAPTVDGQIFAWDTTTSKWKISTAIAPSSGQVLKWNSSSKSWEPGTDVTGGTPGDSSYSAKGLIEFDTDAATSGMVYSSSGVAKVNKGTGANQIVALDASSKLPAVDGSALTNINAVQIQGKAVTLTSPAANQVLQYDGTKFVNATVTDNDSFAALPCGNGYLPYKTSGAWTCLQISSSNVASTAVSRDASGISQFGGVAIVNGTTAVSMAAAGAGSAYTLTWPASAPGSNGMVLTSTTAGALSWASALTSSLNSGNIFVGNGSNQATSVAMSGDATIDNTGALTLAAAGTAGTYYKVTTDSKGRVTSGSASLSSSDIPSAAGDVSGAYNALSVDKLKGKAIDSTAPTVDGQIFGWDTTTSKWKISTAIAPTNGQVLKWNSTSKSWEPAADATGGAAVDSSYTAKGNVQFDTDAPTSGMVYSSSGVAKVNVGTGANQIVALDASSKLPAVDGSALTNVNATKINGVATSIAALANGQILQYNGTNWVNVAIPADTLGGMSCTSGQVAYYNGSAWVCQSTNTLNSTNTLVMRNGSGVSEFAGIALANGTTNVTMAAATAGAAYTLTWPSNLPASNGMVLTSTTAGALSWSSVMTNSLTTNHIFVGSGGVATDVAMSGDATIASSGALTIANSAITDAKVSSSAAIARSKLASGTGNGLVINNSSGAMTDMTCSSAGQVPSWNGTTWTCITPLTTLPTLANTKIWVGNGSSTATAVSMSGDASISNTGSVTVSKINGVAPTTTATASAVLQLDSSSVATTKGVNLSNGSNAVQMRAPSSFTTYTMTMPTTAGTNGQFLQTDGSGNLSWASANTGGGGFTTKTTDFTVQTTENNYIYAVTGVAAVTLPAASAVSAGIKVTFKNVSAGNVTVSPSGSDFIDNGQQATLATNGYTTLVSDGSGFWYVLAGSPTVSAATCTPGTQTFTSISSVQTLNVTAPNAMACKYTITVLGAGGGGTNGGVGGGISISNLKLPTYGTLNVVVGKKGQKASVATTAYGGGGAGGTSNCTSITGGGGGASAVQINSTVLAVAGGGGGGGTGSYAGGIGGSASTVATAGAGVSGTTGGGAGFNNTGGSAGVNTYTSNGAAGGSSGASGGSGTNVGLGGANISSIGISGGGGGWGSIGSNYCAGGGGGGYGGGGGGALDTMSNTGSAGGGGGGYVNSSVISAGAGTSADTTGSAAGNDGSVVITWN